MRDHTVPVNAVKWRTSIEEKLLLDDDFKIYIGNEWLPCHRKVLAAHSLVLRDMLEAGMAEAALGEAHLLRVSMNTMKHLWYYMYGVDLRLNSEQLLDVVAACDYLQMDDMQKICENKLESFLMPDNVIALWKAAEQYHLEYLQERCEEMMPTFLDIISQSRDFLELQYHDVELIMDVCGWRDPAVVKALQRWITHTLAKHGKSLDQFWVDIKNLKKLKPEQQKDHPSVVIPELRALMEDEPLMDELLSSTGTGLSDSRVFPNKLLVVGGLKNKRRRDVARPEQVLDRTCWSVGSNGYEPYCQLPIPEDAQANSVCPTPDGFAITGGNFSRTCALYNALLGRWEEREDMMCVRMNHGSRCVNGKLYVFAGHREISSQGYTHVEVLSLAGGSWQAGPEIPQALLRPQAADIGNKIYVLDKPHSRLLVLDTEKEVWENINFDFGEGVCQLAMTAARDRLYMVTDNAQCAWYSQTTRCWRFIQPPSLMSYVGTLRLVYSNYTILLLGGKACPWDSSQVEELDMMTHKWTVKTLELPRGVFKYDTVVVNGHMQSTVANSAKWNNGADQ